MEFNEDIGLGIIYCRIGNEYVHIDSADKHVRGLIMHHKLK